MPVDPCDLVRRYHAAINALDFAAMRACFAEDAVYASAGTGPLEGREEIMAAFERYFAEYPDQVATDSLIEETSPLSARSFWHLSATGTSTGTRIERQGEQVAIFDSRGLIVRIEVTDIQTDKPPALSQAPGVSSASRD